MSKHSSNPPGMRPMPVQHGIPPIPGDIIVINKLTILTLQLILGISFLFSLYLCSDIPSDLWNTPYIVLATMNAVLHPVGILLLFLLPRP